MNIARFLLFLICSIAMSSLALGQNHLLPSKDIFAEWNDTAHRQMRAREALFQDDGDSTLLMRRIGLSQADDLKFTYTSIIEDKDKRCYLIRRETLSAEGRAVGALPLPEIRVPIDRELALAIHKAWIKAILQARWPDYAEVQSGKIVPLGGGVYYSAFETGFGVVSAEDPVYQETDDTSLPFVMSTICSSLTTYLLMPERRPIAIKGIQERLLILNRLLDEQAPKRPAAPPAAAPAATPPDIMLPAASSPPKTENNDPKRQPE